MTTRILLMCALGVDCAEDPVDFWVNGKLTRVSLAYSLRKTFSNIVDRIISPHIVLLPFLARYHLTRFERDTARNARALRAFCEGIIAQRKVDIARDPNLAKAGDFMTLLLVDDHF